MMNLINKYISEIDQLEEKMIGEEGNIKEEYQSTILDIIENVADRLFIDVAKKEDLVCIKSNQCIVYISALENLLDEVCYRYSNESKEKNKNNWKIEATNRLIMMYIKHLREVTYLLKGGFATAAFARVRAIFEIVVFLEIISTHDEEISEKFLKHCNTNRIKVAKSLNDVEFKTKIEDQISEFNFGEEFNKDYQWANSLITKNRITFRDLVEITTLKEIYHIYVYSCSCVHASVYNSINGFDVNPSIDKANYWNTTETEEGAEMVVKNLALISKNCLLNILNKNL